MLVMILVLAVIFWVGYITFKPDKRLKEPLYRRYKADPFIMRWGPGSPYIRNCGCSICKKDEKCREYSNLIQLCWACGKKLESTEILKEQGIPLDVMQFNNSESLLYILNLVQIDLQQGNITESEAKCITNETAKEMIENATYYKRAKKAAGGKRLVYDKVGVTFLRDVEDVKCMICGHDQHLGCSLCEAHYKSDLKAKKFPNKLKEILNRIGKEGEDYINKSYTYCDWRYLNLIAKDLERGFIEKTEALSEAERYIDLIYNDIKNVPEELVAKKNAPPKPVVKTESEKFMDDILS